MDDENSQVAKVTGATTEPALLTKSVAWDSPKVVTLLISITSLAVSLFVFYFQNVQVRHGLTGALYYVGLNEARDQGMLRGEFLIANGGNQVEVVRSVDFVLAVAPDCIGGFVFSADPAPSPTTLKPGESSVLKLGIAIADNFKASVKDLKFRPGGTFDRQAYLCGLFNVLGPNGEPDNTMYRFGAVQVNTDGTLEGPYDHSTVNRGLIKLPGEHLAPKPKPIAVQAPAVSASEKQ